MSNELTMLDKSLPSYLKELELDATTKALMGGAAATGGYKRISIDGSVWRMYFNGKEIAQSDERFMHVVIVSAAEKVNRIYYGGTYKKGQKTAPDCWSENGDVPNEKAKNPQAKRCVDCAQNAKGSGQGTSRACRFQQRLAVVLANDIGGDVFQLVLPSTSVFGEGEPGKWPLQMYSKMIGGKGVPVTAVVTEMRFDTNSSTPKVIFKPVRVLDNDEHEIVIRQGKTDAAIKAITMTVAETDGVTDEQPRLEAAPQKVEAEMVEEPVKRSAKKEEEPAPKKDLSKILSEWDDA
jgi:hypothetical protein